MSEEAPRTLDPQAELHALTARVAQLELLVAQLELLVSELRTGMEARPTAVVSSPLAPAGPPPRPSFPPQAPGTSGATTYPPAFVQPIPPRPAAPPSPALPPRSLEQRLGSQVFNAVGIVALIAGAAYFLKLAIDHGLIGPLARVIIGLIVGAGLIVWSERFRRKAMLAFSYSLKGVGTVILYLALWAGFQHYHLLPAWAALAAMVLVTAWNAFMAWTQDAELLAWYALVGGLLTPVLLATGGNHEAFLFVYVAIFDVATVALIRFKPWHRLLLPAYLFTAGYFIGWYSRYFHLGAVSTWNGESTKTVLFWLLFFVVFATVSLRGWARNRAANGEAAAPTHESDVILGVLIPLANAVFLGCALYSVLEDSGLHAALPWAAVALAALFLGLMRVQQRAVSSAMQLAAAVIYLTIAIPLKASGHTLTTAWLVEGLVLYWAGTRLDKPEDGRSESASARVLWVLSAGGYLLGLASLLLHWGIDLVFSGTPPDFFSANLAAAIVAVATLTGLVWLATKGVSDSPANRPSVVGLFSLIAIDGVALLLCLRELTGRTENVYRHAAFANSEFATALLGIAILAAASWFAYRLASNEPATAKAHPTSQPAEAGFAAITFILANLVTILVGEREIEALFRLATAELDRALAVSAFLMLYGAALLAVGFVRRAAFVRWQGLILLVFTICKVFLYDMSGLSGPYRVASLMGLGALLLGVSYAYQKDWLALKAPAADPAAVPLATSPPPPPPSEVQL